MADNQKSAFFEGTNAPENSTEDPKNKARSALKALWGSLGYGGKYKISRACGLTPRAAAAWKVVPARHVGRVASLTGLQITDLRPDLFPMDNVPEIHPPEGRSS